jgi:DNA-binding transcriptional MocR family regulator
LRGLVAVTPGATRFVQLMHGWWDESGPLHERVAAKLRTLIRNGDLPANTRLPSERLLATGLAVSRNTINLAFEALRADGLVASRQGAGTFVSLAGRYGVVRGDVRLASLFGASSTPASEPDHGIDLRSAALPAVDLVRDELSRTADPWLLSQLPTHGYIPGGLPELRSAVAAYYSCLGLPTNSEQILITSGAMQALRLVASGFLEPKMKVVIEEPTFRGAIEALRGVGAQLIPVPSGPEGVDIEVLVRLLRQERPAMVVLMASGHNPTGASITVENRRTIAKLFNGSRVMLVEDASVADATIDGAVPAPLATFGCNAVTIGSASKSFWGGLRVGWIHADPQLIKQLAAVKAAQDLGTSLITQELTVRLLDRIDEARDCRRATLGQARDVLLKALSRHLPEWEASMPRGGASLWATIPTGSAEAVCALAGRHGVYVMPGSTFSCVNRLDSNIRVAFAQPVEIIEEGVLRLGEAWMRYKQMKGFVMSG